MVDLSKNPDHVSPSRSRIHFVSAHLVPRTIWLLFWELIFHEQQANPWWRFALQWCWRDEGSSSRHSVQSGDSVSITIRRRFLNFVSAICRTHKLYWHFKSDTRNWQTLATGKSLPAIWRFFFPSQGTAVRAVMWKRSLNMFGWDRSTLGLRRYSVSTFLCPWLCKSRCTYLVFPESSLTALRLEGNVLIYGLKMLDKTNIYLT